MTNITTNQPGNTDRSQKLSEVETTPTDAKQLVPEIEGFLRKKAPAAADPQATETAAEAPAAQTIAVKVGFYDNLETITLTGDGPFTVGEALAAAKLNTAGCSPRISRKPVALTDQIEDGQTIRLYSPIEGN